MRYVDYSFYVTEYGGTLPDEVFNRLVVKASAYVNYITMGRSNAAINTHLANDIKLATCAVLEEYQASEKGELSSQTVGPWTKVYKTSGKTAEQKLTDAAEHYLLFTGLMYRGCL